MKFILNAKGQPELVEDVLEWADWFEHADRKVDSTWVRRAGWLHWLKDLAIDLFWERSRATEMWVSTVFLGLDYGFGGPPILWETMVFGGKWDGAQYRHSTLIDAKQGHHAVVHALRYGKELP